MADVLLQQVVKIFRRPLFQASKTNRRFCPVQLWRQKLLLFHSIRIRRNQNFFSRNHSSSNSLTRTNFVEFLHITLPFLFRRRKHLIIFSLSFRIKTNTLVFSNSSRNSSSASSFCRSRTGPRRNFHPIVDLWCSPGSCLHPTSQGDDGA